MIPCIKPFHLSSTHNNCAAHCISFHAPSIYSWVIFLNVFPFLILILILSGHQRAVSYVRHLDADSLLSASTDNSIRLWDLRGTDAAAAAAGEDVAGKLSAPGCSAAAAAVPAGSRTALPSASTQQTTIRCSSEPRLAMTYGGHVNERNFVGLSVSSTGFVASGSENNQVYCYHKVRYTCRTKLNLQATYLSVVSASNAFGKQQNTPN